MFGSLLIVQSYCQRMISRPISSSLRVNINIVQYRGKKIYKCRFILFFHFLKNCNDVSVMYCLPVGCNNKKKTSCRRSILTLSFWWSKRDFDKSSNLTIFIPFSKVKVSYSTALWESNITLASFSLQHVTPIYCQSAAFVNLESL